MNKSWFGFVLLILITTQTNISLHTSLQMETFQLNSIRMWIIAGNLSRFLFFISFFFFFVIQVTSLHSLSQSGICWNSFVRWMFILWFVTKIKTQKYGQFTFLLSSNFIEIPTIKPKDRREKNGFVEILTVNALLITLVWLHTTM